MSREYTMHPNPNAEHLSETPEPTETPVQRPVARPSAARDQYHTLLRWAAAGATVLALGAGAALLGSNAGATFAQTGPNPPPPPGQTGQSGQQQPAGGWLLGVMVEDGQNGAVVRRVVPGSAAATAGIQAGDIITAVDGQAVANAQALRTALSGKQVGNTVNLTLNRNGAVSTVTATLTAPQFAQGQGQGQGQNGQGQGQQGQRGPGRGHDGAMGRGGFGGGGMGGFGGLNILQGVAPDQIFSHLLGGQQTVLDASGNRVTLQTTPGKVTAVTANSLTIQANDPQRGTVTYSVTADTKVPGHFTRQQGQGQGQGQTPPAPPTGQQGQQGQGQRQMPQMTAGSITDFQAGDQVVVVSDAANPTVAKAVMGHHQGQGK